MPLRMVTADVLQSGAQYIAHQCNCRTRHAKGLAAAVFARHPRADTYAAGRPREVGTLDVFPPTAAGPGVINCNAQDGPGRPRGSDSALRRLEWFRQCLRAISRIEGILRVGGLPAPHRLRPRRGQLGGLRAGAGGVRGLPPRPWTSSSASSRTPQRPRRRRRPSGGGCSDRATEGRRPPSPAALRSASMRTEAAMAWNCSG
ncbi:unnamed protein product [Prorocentrum cordatum]|uniref:Uncharacterized protein n=1 Tax=Prorocentrum cordatum TaxID=2364126 RepID=A0ABN9VEG7_9DINO|nr:unnamed protein product [Polarella glacialis]